MIKAFFALILANVLAFGADGILRAVFKLHIPYQQWWCLNGAWMAIMAFSKPGRRL